MVASWPNSLAAFVAALTECGYTVGFTDPEPELSPIVQPWRGNVRAGAGLRTQREYKESIGRRLAAR